MRDRVLRDRRGMTLVELLIAMVVMGMVGAAALDFVQRQSAAFSVGAGRMSALQNYRFAAEVLERNVRTVGTGVPGGQPYLVYADSATLAFNADRYGLFWHAESPQLFDRFTYQTFGISGHLAALLQQLGTLPTEVRQRFAATPVFQDLWSRQVIVAA